MTEKTPAMVRLDARQSNNWAGTEHPVAILNEKSTLHDRIAHCWGLAKQLHVLSDFLDQHENREIREVAALFGAQLMPLEALLEKLGSDTQHDGET